MKKVKTEIVDKRICGNNLTQWKKSRDLKRLKKKYPTVDDWI